MNKFNIRVYGILINGNNQVLVSDEFIKGNNITKFPGGGLEFGEGTRDCLIREFKEETNLEVTIGEHLYTTDFLQISAFNKNDQVISIYYFVSCPKINLLKTSTKPFDFNLEGKDYDQSFRWISLTDISEEHLTLPIDKHIIKFIKN